MSTLVTIEDNIEGKLNDSANRFYSSANIRRAIGDSYAYYVGKMIELGEGWFETTANLNLTADVEAISLASLTPPFSGIISQLERYVTNGRIPLFPSQRRYRENITVGQGSGDSYRPMYKRRGFNLILEPRPGTTEANGLKLDYVYIPTYPTSSSADSFDFNTGTSGITSNLFPTQFEKNVELRAIIKLLSEKEANGAVVDWQTFKSDLEEMDEVFLATIRTDEMPEDIEYVGVDYSYF